MLLNSKTQSLTDVDIVCPCDHDSKYVSLLKPIYRHVEIYAPWSDPFYQRLLKR